MTKIVLTTSDLDANDFRIGRDSDGGKIIQLNPNAGNIVSYDANNPGSSIATFANSDGARRRLTMNGPFGYLHLDFTARVTARKNNSGFYLPSNAPTPRSLLEVQTRDGGTIFIRAGSRNIEWDGLTVGQRYIVDIIGFWNI